MWAVTTPTAAVDHVIVVGATTTAVRLVEELSRAGERVVVLVPLRPSGTGRTQATTAELSDDLERLDVEVRPAEHVDEPALRGAGVQRAKAVAVIGEDDVTTVRIALAVEDLNAEARLVLELANHEFGERLKPLLGSCIVLSSAGLAAPSFVAAAMPGGQVTAFELAGRSVAAGSRSRVGGETLAVLGGNGKGLLGTEGDIILGTKVVGADIVPPRQLGLLGAFARVFDRRLRWVIGGLGVLMVISALYFHWVGHLDWWSAIYVALTASTLTGIGDVNDLNLGTRFGGVVIQLFGLILSSGITAVIVDALISARLASLTGGVRGRPRNHFIVCGLGTLGQAVVSRLHARGVGVVAIERSEETPGVLAARRARIPVVIADASDPAVLEQAGSEHAQAVLAITDNDAANLEVTLLAHQQNPDVRIVTRVFDHELGDRVERRLATGPTRSVSSLAAPAFAAAVLGRRSETIIAVGRRVIILTELRIQPGSRSADGVLVDSLEKPGDVRVLAVRKAGEDEWKWHLTTGILHAGDRVAVAATRAGLAGLLRQLKRPTLR